MPYDPLSPDSSQQRVGFQHVPHMLRRARQPEGPGFSFSAAVTILTQLLPREKLTQHNVLSDFPEYSPPQPSGKWQETEL